MLTRVANYFKFNERNTTFKKEIIGGLSAFLTMTYILAVNPQIIATGFGKSHDDLILSGLFLITAIVTIVGTLLIGLVCNLPIGVSIGMGSNSFFGYTLTTQLGVSPTTGLLAAFISSIIFFILSVTNVRKYMFNNIPESLKYAIASGIGIYIVVIGFKNIGLVNQVQINGSIIGTLSLGYLGNPAIYLGLAIFLLAVFLSIKKIPGSLPIAMIVGLVLGLLLHINDAVKNMPNWDSLTTYKEQLNNLVGFKDVAGTAFNDVGKSFTQVPFYVGCLMFLLILFFDSTGNTIAFMGEINKYNPSVVPEDKRIMFSIDSGVSVLGTALGTTGSVVFGSSAVGITQGSRTGFSALVVTLMFIIVIPLYPFIKMFFPYNDEIINQLHNGAHGLTFSPITGAALIFAGGSMFSGLRNVNFGKIEESIPTLFLLAIMMITVSIPNGIAFGFITYVFIKVAQKEWKQVNTISYVLVALLIIYLAILILMDLKIIS